MAKSFFRFLRGEINGFYLRSINEAVNATAKDIRSFFTIFKSKQFELGKIDENSLYGLGSFAGIFLPILTKADSVNSLKMTESYIEDGTEYSECGLFNTEQEKFEFFPLNIKTAYFFFVRTNQTVYTSDINATSSVQDRSSLVGDETVLGYISANATDIFDTKGNIKTDVILSVPPTNAVYTEYYGDNFLFLSEGDESDADEIIKIRMTDSNIVDGVEYSERGLFKVPIPKADDINKLATPRLRSSMTGNENIVGYISSEETDLFDSDGDVRPEKILKTPPKGVAYSDYYGDKFLFLSDAEVSHTKIASSLYIELFKALQWVRYNGISVKSLCKIIELVCPDGLVTIQSIISAPNGKQVYVYYNYNASSNVTFKLQRLNLLEYIVNMKFIQVTLVEYTYY